MHEAQSPQQTTTHEQEFLQRYKWLMTWAYKFTGRNKEQAEDLVHDVFVQFMLDRRDLNKLLENLDGYLYVMLRNMHFSQVKRASRLQASSAPLAVLPLSEYDTAAESLQAIRQRDEEVQEELYQICRYAYSRKASSKAGSVLLLRFFHGYYPTKSALLLRTTRATVDKWLQIARAEAKIYISGSETLSFLRKKNSEELPRPDAGQSNVDFIQALTAAIFALQSSECEVYDQLEGIYRETGPLGMSSETLGHVVSCTRCLDRVNEILGLPLLSERDASKSLSSRKRDKKDGPKPPTDKGATGGPPIDRFISKAKHRLKEVFNHRPHQLRIAVNGFILASQDVSSEWSAQTLTIKEDDFKFIEVLSEQEVRFLLFSVEAPPKGEIQQSTLVGLSDDRTIELLVDFSAERPKLQVIYRDPTLEIEPHAVASERTGISGSWKIDESATGTGGPVQEAGFIRRVIGVLGDKEFWRRPYVISALTLLALIPLASLLIAYFNRTNVVVPVTVSSLLKESFETEQEIYSTPETATHRTIRFEERSPTNQATIAKYRIESWHSTQQQISVKRLYDESGNLVAGNWAWPDNTETLYRPDRLPHAHFSRPIDQLPANIEDLWALDISAKPYLSLAGQATQKLSVSEGVTTYAVSYKNSAASGENALLNATLILRRGDLHTIEETLLVVVNGVQREFHFKETGFELKPAHLVAPEILIPDHELLPAAPVVPSDHPPTKSLMLPPATSSPGVVSYKATPEMLIEALRLLHQAHADTGEQINADLSTSEQLEIKGVVETEQRKQEILAQLEPLSKNKAIHIQIGTAEEYLKHKKEKGGVQPTAPPERFESSASVPPAAEAIRKYLSNQQSSSDDAINRYANHIVNQSRELAHEAAALKHLTEQVAPARLTGIPPEARLKWLSLVHEHARRFLLVSMQLRAELQGLYSVSGVQGRSGMEIANDGDLGRAIDQLYEAAAMSDRLIRASFTVSSGAQQPSGVNIPQFWSALLRAEKLAEEIQRMN